MNSRRYDHDDRLATRRPTLCRFTFAVVGLCTAVAAFNGHAAADTAATTTKTTHAVKETVRERYADGRVKIEREVTVDRDGNYVNHGSWRMWDPSGKLVAEGRHEWGQRVGSWTRWFSRSDAAILSTSPFDQFEAPFESHATFTANRPDGPWTINDAQRRKCSLVTFKHGKRNGPALVWLPSGDVFRKAAFRNGLPDGDISELDGAGELKTLATYLAGRQFVNKVTHFPESDQKQTEAACLAATVVEVTPDDFWQLHFAEYSSRSEVLRHGAWKHWYPTGQLQQEGFYQYDREEGSFTWWHAHGQEAVQGAFVDGLPDGPWTWWHPNGQKAAEGHYSRGQVVGTWRSWAEDGRLVQSASRDESIAKRSGPELPTRLTESPGPAGNQNNNY